MNEEEVVELCRRITCAQIVMHGMAAENQVRAFKGEAPAYDEHAFVNIIAEYELYGNIVTEYELEDK
jgi:hypothetical protein